MDVLDWILELIVVFLAVLLADWVINLWNQHKKPDIYCDACEEPRRTTRTKDKRFWLCKKCMETYLYEKED